MQFKLSLVPAAAAAFMLAACGGGGSNPAPVTPGTPSSGVAVDGYLSFSKVVCDANGNGLGDDTEAVVYTQANGRFTFPDGCSFGVIATGGTSQDTQLPFVGILKAPAGAKVASPLTTLLVAGMTQAQLNSTLDLPANTDLLNTDPGLLAANGSMVNSELMKKTLAVQQLLQKTTEAFAGLAGASGSAAMQPIYNEVAAAFAAILKAGAKLNSTDTEVDVAVVKALVKAAADQVAAAASVMGAVKTALAAVNATALAEVVAGGMKFEADAMLQASDATLTAVTKKYQSDDTITSYVHDHAGQLAGTPSAATLAAMGAALTQLVISGPPTPTTSGTVLLSFDEATPAFTEMGGYGGALPTVEVGPAGGSGSALKIVKPVGQEVWGGIYFSTATIPFTADRKKITARVYSTRANAAIKFKVEVPGGSSVEVVGTPTVAANTWTTVTWDFAAVDLSKAYKVIAITPDAEAVTTGASYYFDDITLAPAGTPAPTPTEPTTAAATPPARAAADVLSIYSDAYTPIAGVNLRPDWGQTTAVSEVTIAGNKTEKYTTFNYEGITFTPIDVSAMTKIHIDVWTPDLASLDVYVLAGGAEQFVKVTPTLAGWNSFDIDLGAYTTLNKAAVKELKLVANGGSTAYLDNIYFWKPAAGGTAPTTAPTAPTALAANVLSIYSDAYTPIAGVNLRPDWGQTTAVSEVTIAGNKVEKYTSFNYEGITFTPIDVSAMTKIHIDVWTPDLASLDVFVLAGGAEQFVKVTPTQAGWNSFDIDLSAYTTLNKAAVKELKLVANGGSTAYLDNIYFWKAPTPAATDYLYLPNNTISLFDGTNTTSYSMDTFTSSGINVKWPMVNAGAIKLNLAQMGTFNIAAGQKLSAAMQVEDVTVAGAKGLLKGYIDNVSVVKTGDSIMLSVPDLPQALIYGVSGDGLTKAVISFANAVKGITNTLSTTPNSTSTVVVGEVVNFAINGLSNNFTNMNALRGKYKVTIVVNELPLRKADGSRFDNVTIEVPTTVAGGVPGGIVPVTGYGLVGYINLTD